MVISRLKESKKIHWPKRGEPIMENTQSLAIWLAMESFVALMRKSGDLGKANPSQPEEVFVPFNLPPVKPEPTEEPKLPVAVVVPSSEARPVGV